MAKKKIPRRIVLKKDYNKLALERHKKMKGKLEVVLKGELKTKDDWSTMYTPGVGAVSSHLAKHPKDAREYTIKRNTVAVVSDGSAVLGLGNLGALGALPVMEGKCAIFKAMAGVDAFPIVLDTQDPEEIIKIVKAIAPTFGGINLEDIAAPQCFMIEEQLKKELKIPVMHDDQHGTAIVVLAGLINASKVVGKKLEKMKVVIVGAGAAGRAVALLLREAKVEDVIVVDRSGIIGASRSGLTGYKKELAKVTNLRDVSGEVMDAVVGADVLVGVSGPGSITRHHIEKMAPKAVVFALANPVPEITPDDAKRAGAMVVATGRSDYPNQVNNALAFPGIFRGALDRNVTHITDGMKLAAAKKIASLVKKPSAENVIPSVMTPGLAKAVASVIKK
ncbi:malate dehydrogenase [Candidatus Kaiserbacteria bacterium RIFCSPHIGHO2_01_FULL_46_22]|uniref:Malate dehydrogenase n=1 Tax=Candidatus Kaiserbacteria bacterium RIFCSPHIGHO2_01_FULL_46_22 TaxID=1798475 RepID=A0A1F6BWZ7_9BACT|nr:MAG: malate dehydrogenase [Candidatus Kaiserbacteria bacterium RIFCSPHIGHO2_01_FULL_46_22]